MGVIPRLLTRFFDLREIVNCDRNVYLRRWYIIRTRKFALFVHQFVRSDEDRALHDHPWPFLVIPIWRGYVEHHNGAMCGHCDKWTSWLEDGPLFASCQHCHGTGYLIEKTRVWPILGTRLRPATYRHRVELLDCDYKGQLDLERDCPVCQGRGFKPSWSIFIRFTKSRMWGFWEDGKFIPWTKWWSDKCE